ncbi:MAG: hypothetical protein QXM58_03550 [Candidatus Micrarchaeaceae archaeon]
MTSGTTREDQKIIHKGLINISDTYVYVIGWVFLLVGVAVDYLAAQKLSSYIMLVGLLLNWIGIILAFFSGAIGNREIKPGYGAE